MASTMERTGRAVPKRSRRFSVVRLLTRPEVGVGGALLLLMAVFAVLEPARFATARNMSNVLTDASTLVVLAIATTFVVVSRNLDLSIGGVIAFCEVLSAKTMTENGGLAIGLRGLLVAVLAGVLWGVLSGLLISRAGMRFTYLSALADPNYPSVACGARIEARRLGATVQHQEAQEFTAAAQIPMVNAAAAAQPDGLLVTPTDPVGLMAPLSSVSRSGVPVVTVVNQLKDPRRVNAQVTVDNVGAGRAAAKYLAAKAGGKKVTVASLGFTAGGSLASDGELRGFQDQLKKYPTITYLGPQYVGSDANASTEAMNGLLAKQPDLFGVFTAFGASAQGVLASTRQRHVDLHIVSGYAAATTEVVNAMRDGQVSAIVDFPFRQAGQTAMQQIVRLAKGQRVTQTTGFSAITYTRNSFADPASARNLGAGKCPT